MDPRGSSPSWLVGAVSAQPLPSLASPTARFRDRRAQTGRPPFRSHRSTGPPVPPGSPAPPTTRARVPIDVHGLGVDPQIRERHMLDHVELRWEGFGEDTQRIVWVVFQEGAAGPVVADEEDRAMPCQSRRLARHTLWWRDRQPEERRLRIGTGERGELLGQSRDAKSEYRMVSPLPAIGEGDVQFGERIGEDRHTHDRSSLVPGVTDEGDRGVDVRLLSAGTDHLDSTDGKCSESQCDGSKPQGSGRTGDKGSYHDRQGRP